MIAGTESSSYASYPQNGLVCDTAKMAPYTLGFSGKPSRRQEMLI